MQYGRMAIMLHGVRQFTCYCVYFPKLQLLSPSLHHRQEVMMAWYVCVRAFRTQFLKFRYSRIVFEIEVGRLLKCVIFCHAEVSPASDILLVQQVDVMRECIGIGIA